MTIRVVQWTTGNVGRRAVRAIDAHPELELVGCYAWSSDKAGRDVGELVGSTRSASMRPMTSTLSSHSVPTVCSTARCGRVRDELVRILEAGVNVASTAAFVNGRSDPADRARIADACAHGGVSMFGTGISPGFVELVAIVLAGISDRIDKVTVSEGSDTTLYDSPETELPVRLLSSSRRPGAGGHGR